MDRRFLGSRLSGVSIETRDDGADGESTTTITGYAASFYDGTDATEFHLWDGAVERIMPGAFDRALKEADDVRALFNHNPDNLLGRTSSDTLSLRADKTGLKYEITPGDTAIARDVIEHIRRGDLQGSSFAFEVTDEEWRKVDDVEIREVRGVRLFDVGPVTYPAYESTTTAVRNCDANGAREARESWAKSESKRRLERQKIMVRARMLELV